MGARIERFGKTKPAALGFLRRACLAIVFITGLLSIVATGPAPTMLTNPYPTASGPYSSQINERYVALHELEVDMDEMPLGSAAFHALSQNATRIRAELAELKAKASAAMSAPIGGCFTADMLVLTADGAKPIADVKAGDRVLSMDESGQQVAADVLKTYSEQGYHYFLINGRIKVTALHRFFTDQGWKRARELKVGDRIRGLDGQFEEITAFEWFAADLDVYNLTISQNHNFYISTDGKSGYLVHNTAGGGGGGGGGGGK